ncbi:MAG: hypothetical protein RLZZ241_1727 [Bacteroidota bacterium]|jgi:hypothetical protein
MNHTLVINEVFFNADYKLSKNFNLNQLFGYGCTG